MRWEFSLVGLAGCIADWFLSRPWRHILICFLPMLIALSTVGLVVGGGWLNRDTLAERYALLANEEVNAWEKQWSGQAVDEAVASGQEPPKKIPASAEMLFRRVQQLRQNDPRSVFFVALSYIQRGATQQGLSMLDRIAPTDRVGYPAAHAYLAEQILARPVKVSEVHVARHHAQAALGWESISPQLLAMISNLFDKLQEPKLSIDAMRQAAKKDAKYYLLLAELSRRVPMYEELSKESWEKAKQSFEEKLSANPQDVGSRLMLADVHRLKQDWVSAEATLVEGLKLSDNPTLKSALSEIYRQVFVSTAKFEGDSWTGDIELLEKAFHLDPNNLRIFEEVAKLARAAGKSPDDMLMKQLRENLAQGRATSVTHMWIAEHYLYSNQFTKAIPHLEQAVKRDPNASRCWNNLAFCLADTDATRLDEALKAVDQAIALAPRIPDYHDTRGTILMKMNKPGDAVTAFERALEAVRLAQGAVPPQPGFHKRLAEAYAALGDEAMAETHRRFAADLTKALNP